MDDFLKGYRRFRRTVWPTHRALFEVLAQRGQKPKALVVACSDSRVDPSMLFDTAPGEIFSIRNVANLVPPYTPSAGYNGVSSALEFGICALEIPHIIILGHTMCGGIKALLHGPEERSGDFIPRWMALADKARSRALACSRPEDAQDACEHESLKLSLANLMTFPWIAERVEAKKLRLHGARVDIQSGILEVLDQDGDFVPALTGQTDSGFDLFESPEPTQVAANSRRLVRGL